MKKNPSQCSISEGMCSIHKDEAVCMHHCTKVQCGCKAYKGYMKRHNIVAQVADDSDVEDQEQQDDDGDAALGTGSEEGDSMGIEDRKIWVIENGIGSWKNKPISASAYILSLNVLGQIWQGKGTSVIKAMEQIRPENVKARGMWMLKHDGKVSQVPMLPPIIKKTLANKMFQEILQKRLTQLLH